MAKKAHRPRAASTKAKSSLTTTTGKNNGRSNKVEAKVIRAMAELRVVLETDNIPELLVAVLSGYSNVRGSAFVNVKAKLAKDNILYTSSSSRTSKGCLRLTEKGIRMIPSDITPPTDNEDIQELLREVLHNRYNNGKKSSTRNSAAGDAAADKLDQVYDMLLDGRVHTTGELLAAAGEVHPRAVGFCSISASFSELGLTEVIGGPTRAVQLTDVVFPFGRPY